MGTTITPSAIRAGVRDTFNRVAAAPDGPFRFGVGVLLAGRVGYPADRLAALPGSAAESFTGLAYLHPYLRPLRAEVILDLGCGAGLDSVLAARAVGPDGTVAGLDIAEGMTAKAGRSAAAAGAVNAVFATGDAEAMPFASGVFDAALANGFFNLCPDKPTVAAELHRVLKPGGRAIVAEITFAEPQAVEPLSRVDDWFR